MDLAERSRQPTPTVKAQERKGGLFRDYAKGRQLVFKMGTFGS